MSNKEQGCREYLYEYYVKLLSDLPETKHRERYEINKKIERYGSAELENKRKVEDLRELLQNCLTKDLK